MRPLGLLFEAALVYYGYYVVHEYVWKKISVSPTQEQAADMRETDDWTLMERGYVNVRNGRIFSPIFLHG
jgi:hypothetical protein